MANPRINAEILYFDLNRYTIDNSIKKVGIISKSEVLLSSLITSSNGINWVFSTSYESPSGLYGITFSD